MEADDGGGVKLRPSFPNSNITKTENLLKAKDRNWQELHDQFSCKITRKKSPTPSLTNMDRKRNMQNWLLTNYTFTDSFTMTPTPVHDNCNLLLLYSVTVTAHMQITWTSLTTLHSHKPLLITNLTSLAMCLLLCHHFFFCVCICKCLFFVLLCIVLLCFVHGNVGKAHAHTHTHTQICTFQSNCWPEQLSITTQPLLLLNF